MSTNPGNTELHVLNVSELDVDELEHRLELAEGLFSVSCYSNLSCDCNCQSNYCTNNVCGTP